LQVRNRGGEWIALPHLPDCLIVNLADMVPRWTNGFYQSTPHRVINTDTGEHRYSMPFFFEPNFDALITTQAQFIDEHRPAQFTPIKFGDHLQNMYNHTYQKVIQKQDNTFKVEAQFEQAAAK